MESAPGVSPGGARPADAEKFQAAAEQYGFIVAASNNARNGPHAVSAAAAQAMSTDVSRRFAIDLQRVYLTGMSGGARVAMGIALANASIAGVVASSGGYPDSQPRDKVSFAVFGTAGTEDFNYVEMRLLDRKLSSPHFLAVFDGGHTLRRMTSPSMPWSGWNCRPSSRGDESEMTRWSVGCWRNGGKDRRIDRSGRDRLSIPGAGLGLHGRGRRL